jgi:hypothetical protein
MNIKLFWKGKPYVVFKHAEFTPPKVFRIFHLINTDILYSFLCDVCFGCDEEK